MARKQLTTNIFITRAKERHGTKYCYEHVSYIKYHVKVKMLCESHGIFWQTPAGHLAGKGCPRCVGRERTTEHFVQAAREVHHARYDYSSTRYVGGCKRLDIICPSHGLFSQVARDHLQGYGCAKCAGRNKTLDEFTNEARAQHGDRYDYSNTVFIGMEQKVEITCSRHGLFWQLASSHVRGRGCPKCSRNTSKAEHLWLDHLGIPEKYRRKSIKVEGYKRALTVDAYDPSTNTIYEFYGDLWHGNPKLFAQDEVHRVAKDKGTYGDMYRRTMEREQTLRALGYNLVTIWESDWTELRKTAVISALRCASYPGRSGEA